MTQTATQHNSRDQSEPRAHLAWIPNSLTASRFPLAPLFAYAFLEGSGNWLMVAFAVAILVVITDWADGWSARALGLSSDFGKLFDPMADAAFFVVAFAALGVGEVVPLWLALVFLVRECLQHLWLRPMAKRRGLVLGAKMIGKVKTVVQMVVLLLIVIFEYLRTRSDELVLHVNTSELFQWLDITSVAIVALAAGLSVLSLFPYLAAALKAGKESPSHG